MNRSLLIPAGCCLLAFVALLATLHQAAARETAAQGARLAATSLPKDRATLPSPYKATPAEENSQISAKEAEKRLTTLTGEYLRPWREWAESPRRLYSRVAPSPLPSISAEVAMSPDATNDTSLHLATIVIRIGAQTQTIPSVVDRGTKQVRLFAEGKWLSEEEWLKKAPFPNASFARTPSQ